MPRRAIFSLLIALAGTLGASGSIVANQTASHRFQPGGSAKPPVFRPGNMNVTRPAAQLTRPVVTHATGIAVGRGQVPVIKPAATAVSPAGSGRRP
jgi:hypothetical protein